ncbi:hypothetical protein DFA_01380 [Cavenderia fasciculata]|uniref:Uncharacterized protein n=1 Tax=Cavenderia fasciculata TaxID=261658 RepID=F4PSG4_CACFS|nr:uncharacterized protein DFA_01380 [Cavenderia fasciculata]EGG21494.1 hypothetical protein DFA_01380 [Cavenderia fasciculata]|eukprot:XP_004359344.1 hypothetical protein DFA_01380 [Cavenderia fasciculata]
MNRKLISQSSSWMSTMMCNHCIKNTTTMMTMYNGGATSMKMIGTRYMSIISKRGGNTGSMSSGMDARPSSKLRYEIQAKQNKLDQASKMLDSLSRQQQDMLLNTKRSPLRLQETIDSLTSTQPDKQYHLRQQQQQQQLSSPLSYVNKNLPTNRTVTDIHQRVQQLEKQPKPTKIKEAKALTKENQGTTEVKYSDNEELIFRLMINEMEVDRHSDEKVHELIVRLPEYQDYNNEVLRCLNQIDMDYMSLGDKEDSWVDNEYFEKRRNTEVEEIRRKHYRRVSDAVDKRLSDFNMELQGHLDGIIDMIKKYEGLTDEEIKNHPVHGYLYEEDEDLLQQTYNSKDSVLGNLEQDTTSDEFQMALEQTLGLAPGEKADISDVPEETQILFHKVMGTSYKRKEENIQHEFSMEPLNFNKPKNNTKQQYQHLQQKDQSQPSQQSQQSQQPSTLFNEDEDFNLKDILKGMKGANK